MRPKSEGFVRKAEAKKRASRPSGTYVRTPKYRTPAQKAEVKRATPKPTLRAKQVTAKRKAVRHTERRITNSVDAMLGYGKKYNTKEARERDWLKGDKFFDETDKRTRQYGSLKAASRARDKDFLGTLSGKKPARKYKYMKMPKEKTRKMHRVMKDQQRLENKFGRHRLEPHEAPGWPDQTKWQRKQRSKV